MKRKNNVSANMTLEEIALELGVTRERVRQIEARALEKIRLYLLQRFGESVTIWDTIPNYKEIPNHEQMQIM